MGEIVEFQPDPFRVEFDFGPERFESLHPPEMTRKQCEDLLVAAMRVAQRCGHKPWEILEELGDGAGDYLNG